MTWEKKKSRYVLMVHKIVEKVDKSKISWDALRHEFISVLDQHCQKKGYFKAEGGADELLQRLQAGETADL